MGRNNQPAQSARRTAKISSANSVSARNGSLYLILLLLGGALAILFHRGFEANQVHFALDQPLGFLKSASSSAPGICAGHWTDFTWLGGEIPASNPGISVLLQSILYPELFLKIFPPLSLLLVGLSAWLMFREFGFGRWVCVFGGLAAGLNMLFLSVACWGLGHWNIAFAMIFLAIAALATKSIRQSWAKAMLAGFAVGLNVVEAFDVGVILSPFVAAAAVFFVLQEEGRPISAKLWKGVWMVVVITVCALIIAAHCIANLVSTQIQGIAGTGQDAQSRQQRWGFNTMWSIPKLETLRIIIPGVFGYRLIDHITSDDKSSAYWGHIGEETKLQDMMSGDPQVRIEAARALGATPEVLKTLAGQDVKARAEIVESFKPNVMRRHTYCGEYAGVLVSLLALLAFGSSFRKTDSPWLKPERNAIWLWFGVAIFSLLAAWGRYGFLYRWLYELPYMSTIRNPMKFMHPFHIAWIILAGFGFEFLRRQYLQKTAQASHPLARFEKAWAIGLAVVFFAALACFVLLLTHRDQLVKFIHEQGFNAELASRMAPFCCGEVAWFLALFAVSAAFVISILSGIWRGPRAKWAFIIAAVILIVDLGRADAPYIYYFDWTQKYSPNPVVEVLGHEPFEHRVASKLSPLGPSTLPGSRDFYTLCSWWTANDFPLHNIESLDISQAPRLPILDRDYMENFLPHGNDWSRPARLWTLTNTRYLLASMEALTQLRARTGNDGPTFQLHTRLDFGRKPSAPRIEDFGDFTVAKDPNGEWALIEFTNALPRTKLYSNWQTMTNDQAALNALASRQFDPTRTVLIANDTPAAMAYSASTADPGNVSITDYSPKHIRLHATANVPAVLLLNDHTATGWSVTVDQTAAKLLRCNFIMRGVFLPAGEHVIEFKFHAPLLTLYVSLTGCVVLILLGGYLFATRARSGSKAA
jgi:hypothetical protein